MDLKTGRIYHHTPGKLQELLNSQVKSLESQIELTESEYQTLKPMHTRQRKNLMRNKPCQCGSGKKFKKCCGSGV